MRKTFAIITQAGSLTGSFATAADAKKFTLAGNATLTFKSKETEDHLTFRVRLEKTKKFHYVDVMTGPSNTDDFQYLGIIGRDGRYHHGTKSRIGSDTVSHRAFEWTWRWLTERDRIPDRLEIWHEGCCGRCGRKLTHPESVASGFGPECITKV